MPTIRVNGTDAYYRDQGARPGVVMVHSSSSASGQWRALIERLQDRFRCLAPDLLGYGRTGSWDGSDLYADEQAIIEALIDLAAEPVHLVGHSYGAMLAALTTLARPAAVRTLTLIEPTMFTLLRDAGDGSDFAEIEAVADRTTELSEAGENEAAARAFLDYWVAPGAFDGLPDQSRATVAATMPKQRREWPFRQQFDLPRLDDLRAIACPILVVRADATTLAASRVVDLILPVLPNVDFAEIQGAGHMSPVTHPDKVNPVVEGFLVRHAGEGTYSGE